MGKDNSGSTNHNAIEIDGDVPLLPLDDMATRHRALTPSIASSYLEAASVCLDRYHASPQFFRLEDNQVPSQVLLRWVATDQRTQAAWANRDDATRDGAYGLAIAAIELSRDLYAVRRADMLSEEQKH